MFQSMRIVITLSLTLLMTACASPHGSSEPHSHKHDSGSHGMQHSFSDIDKWTKAFDDPERDKWQRPDYIIEQLDVGRAKCIADIGAGTGYFSTRIARKAPRATVYAVDIEPNMVAHLKSRAAKEGLKNHRELLSTTEFPQIPTNCDLVLLVDTYHHIDNRSVYFKKGLLHLNKRGRLAIVDFTLESPVGPKKEHRIPPQQVIAELEQLGYKLRRDVKGLPNQYFLIFESPL